MCRRKFSLVFTLVLFCLLPALEVVGEQKCDPYLKLNLDNLYGYRLRGDRCEGIYIQERSRANPLLIASLTESFEDYDLTSDKSLLLEWTAPPNSADVQLRGYALKPRLYYRMDTERPQGSKSYTWPSNLLASLNLTRKYLGVVGWTQSPLYLVEQNVYLPLRIRPHEGSIRYGLLFSTKLAFQSDLDNGKGIFEDLRQEFENNGISLSQSTTTLVKERGSRWLIKDNKQIYSVRKEDNKLNVYRFRSYRVVILAGVELTEVYISLAPVEEDGRLGDYIQDGEALNYGFYPAEGGIEFVIPGPETPGIYYLKIAATIIGGELYVVERCFYHPGN